MSNSSRNQSNPAQKIFVCVDVESDGPAPGLYSMLSFGLVDAQDVSKRFYAELAPISDDFIPEAMAVGKFTREQVLAFTPAEKQMQKMLDWVTENYAGKRVVLVSDNPAFDWQFINYYCVKFLKKNPFGHSARRIGDVWAGLQNNFNNDSGWKKLRDTSHTHNAEDDALGNAQALQKILKMMDNEKKNVSSVKPMRSKL